MTLSRLTQEEIILRTIIFFDIFSYPLTEMEIWKWQYHDSESQKLKTKSQKFELSEIVEILNKSEILKKVIDCREGFYFLKGREDIIAERKKRYIISDKKIRQARFWINFLHAPFSRAIAICNTLGYLNARKTSDIDLLVIAEHNHIWSTRFFLTGFLKLFKLRPGDAPKSDSLCPSFFIDSINLNIKKLTIDEEDPYLLYWLNNIILISGNKKYFQDFSTANIWIKDFLPAALDPIIHPRLSNNIHPFYNWLQKITERFFILFPLIEKRMEFWQKKIMPDNLKRLALESSSGVHISPTMLKFHENDRRQYFKKEFQKKFKDIIDNINNNG